MAGEIQKILAFLSDFTKIDFTSKEAELGSLVQKYDKDKNSIFDSKEPEAIKNDLSVFENDESTEENVDLFLSDLTAIGRQNKEDIIKKWLDKIDNKRVLSPKDIEDLLEFDNDRLERMLERALYIEGREEQFSVGDMIRINSLSEEEFEQAKQLFNIENRKEQFSVNEIKWLLELNDEEFERAKRLFTYENRGEQISGYGIIVFAKLNEDELEKAKQLVNDEEVYKRFYRGDLYGEIACLAKLSDKELEQARPLFYVQNGKYNFSAFEIAELVKLDDEELQWLSKYFNRGIMFKEYILIARNHCKELEEYIDSEPSVLPIRHNGGGVKLRVYRDDNTDKYNVYDKTGIVETITSERIPESEVIKSGKITTCYNKKLRIEQVIISGNLPNKDDEDIVFSEVLRQFDENGDVIKTVTTKRNPENGTLNVSETDKNGKQIPIQWESIDTDTGATITERHLASPDGTKTDYYSEENENLRVNNYKITDNEGNVLINVHQTFEQVAENKFISSILATDNPKDTQVYEMEYTENGIVKIFDKKSNRTTEINLNEYVYENESLEELISTIKNLPGQVILEFAEKPFKFIYNANLHANANWHSGHLLVIGNYKNTIKNEKNTFAALLHELGHYLDVYEFTVGKISDNQEIITIYEDEANTLKTSATTEQQSYIEYFLNNNQNNKFHTFYPMQHGRLETVAETHSMLYSKEDPISNQRRLYLAQYFPRTIAVIMKALLEEEGVKI